MRYNIWACLIALLTVVPVVPVQAEEITLSWTNPTETFNMTPAGAYTNPGGTKIYLEVADLTDATATTITLPPYKPGTYRFVAVSYDDQGVASPVSSPAEKVVTSFRALAGSTVHQVVTINNGLWLIPIGTVAADTECIPDQQVNGMYAVPVASVTWNSGTTARPPLVVAACQ